MKHLATDLIQCVICFQMEECQYIKDCEYCCAPLCSACQTTHNCEPIQPFETEKYERRSYL